MKSVKLVGVHMTDQRKALALINSPDRVSELAGKSNGCGYWSSNYPHVSWWIWETVGGCVCIQADYRACGTE